MIASPTTSHSRAMNFSSQNIQVRAYLKTNSGVFRRVDEFRERVDIDLSDVPDLY